MRGFLRQPFPVNELNFPRTVVLSLFFGAMIAFCLVVFQPFGSYTWQAPHKNLILSGYGLVAAFSVFLNFYVFRKLSPTIFAETRWTVGKEMVWNLLHFVTGGFLSTVYGAAMGIMPFSLPQVSFMIVVAFLMGLVPAVLIVLIVYVYQLQKYRPLETMAKTETAVEKPEKAIEAEIAKEPTLTLTSENEKESLSLPAPDLLYVEASDNYCTVYYRQADAVKKQLLRSSLSRLENQINLPQVVRCHRSFLVNLNAVQTVSGNAQGYKLHFTGTDLAVPVARASSGVVKSFFVES